MELAVLLSSTWMFLPIPIGTGVALLIAIAGSIYPPGNDKKYVSIRWLRIRLCAARDGWSSGRVCRPLFCV